VKGRGYGHVLLMGMGGSSLGPEVLSQTFGRQGGFPELLVLDSTDPQQVRAFEKRIDVKKTLFIVASKSGSTLEPNIFLRYFHDLAQKAMGKEEAAKHFVAITDPGSKLEALAKEEGFWKIFSGVPSVGGRYSALSAFGMVPAAAMGVDVAKLLDGAQAMADACGAGHRGKQNPGVLLGTVLGVAAKAGRDKVTFVSSAEYWDLGAWLEQLIAESTGKHGKAIIPVDRETTAGPMAYGNDRVFVQLRTSAKPNPIRDQEVSALAKAGHPVVRISIQGPDTLGAEFFRWEVATAVAGAHLGINPFDQPDVEAAKVEARKLTDAYEREGKLPSETPFLEEGGIALYADEANKKDLDGRVSSDKLFASYLRAHIHRSHPNDYVALLAFIEMNERHEQLLMAIRDIIRDKQKVATCLGFGPRFLHSTGQAYKGGPGTGVFLQITSEDAEQVQVPGQKYTFGVVKAAQARGDYQVLVDRKRRVLRVHLGSNVEAGLRGLVNAFQQAL
jgi:glucose-6-phosphate isomerase